MHSFYISPLIFCNIQRILICFLPGCPDLLNKVQKYYQESLDAEQRCNASVFGPQSPVVQSQHTRNITEALLDQRKDKFMRNVTAQKKSLSELKKNAENMDEKVHHLNQKVDKL